jgi:hypothetical protein
VAVNADPVCRRAIIQSRFHRLEAAICAEAEEEKHEKVEVGTASDSSPEILLSISENTPHSERSSHGL